MSYLLDTDRVAEFLKGVPEAVERVRRLSSGADLAISVVSYGELLEGIFYGSNPEQHERDFRRALHYIDVLPLSTAIFERFARVRGQLPANRSIDRRP